MASQDHLADVLADLARTLVTDLPIQGILDHLVLQVVDVLPVDAAGVSLISSSTRPRLVAGSDESATRYEHLQSELDEGPCLAAYDAMEAVAIPDLRLDRRFGRFTERALAEGLVAVFTFPLRHDGQCLGALDLYRTTPGPLDESDMAASQTLADVATAYLLNARGRVERTEFVESLSHELRTPMTIISGSAELLLEEEAGPLTTEQVRLLTSVRHHSDRLLVLADDLLALSSLGSDQVTHPWVEVDLGRVLLEVRSTMDPVIGKRALEVDVESPLGSAVVRGDLLHLESLVTNLLSNAVKFTPDGGWVRCTLDVVDGQARLVVRDSGIGIPLAEQAELFTRFFRSSTARSRAIQGSGLGLTIVASVVHGHGGEVTVASAHLEGSTFTVTLPLAAPSTSAAAPAP